MKVASLPAAVMLFGALHTPVQAAKYEIDPAHSFVEFRIQHLGYSWLYGRFNDLDGAYMYEADNPGTSQVNVTIDTASVDTNHAKRDKHIRSEDFLHVDEHPEATFKSTGYSGGPKEGTLTGELTLNGVTKEVSLDVKKLGEGKDPWGGYRSGFVGTTTIDRRDFGIDYELGPASWEMQLELGIEGVRQ